MRHLAVIITTGLLVMVGIGKTAAYDDAHYTAVKAGNKDCPYCDLSGADFSGIKISGVDLSGANLTEANLSGAAFTKVNLSGADLTSAIVEGTDFSQSNFESADLNQVDLTKAVLVGAKIETAYCDWATKVPQGTGMACEGVAIVRK